MRNHIQLAGNAYRHMQGTFKRKVMLSSIDEGGGPNFWQGQQASAGVRRVGTDLTQAPVHPH